MILEVGVNSYLTVEEADILVSNNLDDDSEDSLEWNKLSTDSKEKLLTFASLTKRDGQFIVSRKKEENFI